MENAYPNLSLLPFSSMYSASTWNNDSHNSHKKKIETRETKKKKGGKKSNTPLETAASHALLPFLSSSSFSPLSSQCSFSFHCCSLRFHLKLPQQPWKRKKKYRKKKKWRRRLRPTYLGGGRLVHCCSFSLSTQLSPCSLFPALHLKQEPKERNKRKRREGNRE